jgi:hypothetical protein
MEYPNKIINAILPYLKNGETDPYFITNKKIKKKKQFFMR